MDTFLPQCGSQNIDEEYSECEQKVIHWGMRIQPPCYMFRLPRKIIRSVLEALLTLWSNVQVVRKVIKEKDLLEFEVETASFNVDPGQMYLWNVDWGQRTGEAGGKAQEDQTRNCHLPSPSLEQ